MNFWRIQKTWSFVIGGTIFEIEPAIALIFELPIGTELTLEYDGSQKCFVDSETGEKLIF